MRSAANLACRKRDKPVFIEFFYHLKEQKCNVSLTEWLDLMDALEQGLCGPSLVDFYYLCRSVLVKSEAEYDRFDRAFALYFRDLKDAAEIPEEVFAWLADGPQRSKEDLMEKWDPLAPRYGLEELRELLAQRLEEQKERHCGGNYWVGTGGTSAFGHGGFAEQGIRIGGEGRYRSALQIAEDRQFRDFREDEILDPRQFQVALRRLRQYSSTVPTEKTELDIDGTIDATSANGGFLKLAFEKPRKNTIKLLLLFDSAGSMLIHSRLCSALFQAVDRSTHFSDLKVYYFHNCIYEHLYKNPRCLRGEWVDTEWVLGNLSSEYRVILVGDGTMAPTELFAPGGNCMVGLFNEIPGIQWLKSIKTRYPHNIWLNPIPKSHWDHVYGHQTLGALSELFPMYELSVDGLTQGIKKLLSDQER